MPADKPAGLLPHIRLHSATGLVVASMIGAGIFTTTGFQAGDLGHPGYIFLLWILGGFLALCGALSFAELGAMLPEAGGEYIYIRESYGRAIAFSSAFVALFAGFSAPIAGASRAFVTYLSNFVPFLAQSANPSFLSPADLATLVVIWLLVLIHARGVRSGIRFNDAVTLVKICGIVLIVGAAAFADGNARNLVQVSPRFAALSTTELFGALATSLIFVNFCYLGWNGAAYVAAEMRNPQRDLPRALVVGTLLVTVLYLALNAFYFYGADVDQLAGKVDVGVTAATSLFGETGVSLVTALLCISILASASAMTIEGPRVYFAFGRDFPLLRFLGRADGKSGAPRSALMLQGVVTSIIALSGTVDQIIQYAGFTLTLFASLAVSCVIVLRILRPDAPRPFRTWGYPFTPLAFLVISLWTMIWAVRGRPVESSLGVATALLGGIMFYALRRWDVAKPETHP
jgi:APA family basic amino acid/polyamine antiporter